MILRFPDYAALELVLRTGHLAPDLLAVPVQWAADPQGPVWVDYPGTLSREARQCLRAWGVRFPRSKFPPLDRRAECWPELLPLIHAPAKEAASAAHLFCCADHSVAAELIRELLRLGHDHLTIGRRTQDGDETFLLSPVPPPYYSVVGALQAGRQRLRVYRQASEGVWVELEYDHPCVGGLRLPDQCWLLISPDGWLRIDRPAMRDVFRAVTLQLPEVPASGPGEAEAEAAARTAAAHADGFDPAGPCSVELPRFEVRLELRWTDRAAPTLLWVVDQDPLGQLQQLVSNSPETLLRHWRFAVVAGECPRVLLRAQSHSQPSPLVLSGGEYAALTTLPGVYLPAGSRLHPPIRRELLERLLQYDPSRVYWLEPRGQAAAFRPQSVLESSFRPLSEWVDYVIDQHHQPLEAWVAAHRFELDEVTVSEDVSERDSSPADQGPPSGALSGGTGDVREALSRGAARVHGASSPPPGNALPPGPGELEAPVAPGSRTAATVQRLPTPAVPNAETRENPETRESRASQGLAGAPGADSSSAADTSSRDAGLRELQRQLAVFSAEEWDAEQRVLRWRRLAELLAQEGSVWEASLCWLEVIWTSDAAADSPGDAAAWWSTLAGRPGPPGAAAGWLLARLEAYWQPQVANRPSAENVEQALECVAAMHWLRVAASPGPGSRGPCPEPPVVARWAAWLEDWEPRLPVRAAWLGWRAIYEFNHDLLLFTRAGDRLRDRLDQQGLVAERNIPAFLRAARAVESARYRSFADCVAELHEATVAWVSAQHQRAAGDVSYAHLAFAYAYAWYGQRERAAAAWEATQGGPPHPLRAWLSAAFRCRIAQVHEGESDLLPLDRSLLEELASLHAQDRFGAYYQLNRARQCSWILEPHQAVDPYALVAAETPLDVIGSEVALRETLAEELAAFSRGDSSSPATVTQRVRLMRRWEGQEPFLGEELGERLLQQVLLALEGEGGCGILASSSAASPWPAPPEPGGTAASTGANDGRGASREAAVAETPKLAPAETLLALETGLHLAREYAHDAVAVRLADRLCGLLPRLCAIHADVSHRLPAQDSAAAREQIHEMLTRIVRTLETCTASLLALECVSEVARFADVLQGCASENLAAQRQRAGERRGEPAMARGLADAHLMHLCVAEANFALEREDLATRILVEARELLASGKLDPRNQTRLGTGYLRALGRAPFPVAKARLLEFLRTTPAGVPDLTAFGELPLDPSAFAAHAPVIEAVVRAMVGPTRRRVAGTNDWLHHADFAIRRRLQRDLESALGERWAD